MTPQSSWTSEGKLTLLNICLLFDIFKHLFIIRHFKQLFTEYQSADHSEDHIRAPRHTSVNKDMETKRSYESSSHVEMVDRGVGPTPMPSSAAEPAPERRMPPYFTIPPYMPDHRTSGMDPGKNYCSTLIIVRRFGNVLQCRAKYSALVLLL